MLKKFKIAAIYTLLLGQKPLDFIFHSLIVNYITK